MKPNYLLLALLLPTLLTGCSSDLLGSKPEPKPKKVVAKKAEKKHAAKAPKPTDNPTTTYAIDDGKNDFKVEAINPPGFQGQFTNPESGQQPVMVAPTENVSSQGQAPSGGWAAAQPTQGTNQPAGQSVAGQSPSGGFGVAQPTQSINQVTGQAPTVGWAAAQPAQVATQGINQATTQPIPQPIAPASLDITVEDVTVPASVAPAVFALSAQADASQKRGDLDGAVNIIERALRIEPRNAIVTYKLALLRLKQNKPQLAEELAGKAALLAGSDLEMKRKSWLLIAEARQNLQNYQGAKEAKTKAESFYGR